MNFKIKKTLKASAGLLALTIALALPSLLDKGAESLAGTMTEETVEEGAHIGPQRAEDLLLLEEASVSRRLTKTPGLTPELREDQNSKGDTPKLARRLRAEADLIEDYKEEIEKAAIEAEKKEAARKEAAAKATEKKSTDQTAPPPSPQVEPEAIPTGDYRFLIPIDKPDPNYKGRPLEVSDRQTLEGLVMGEYGNDYLGAVLVAQCIRDSMVKEGTNSTAVIKKRYGYTAPIKRNVSKTVKQAVAFVFDEGGSGVQHPIYYFYASNLVRGKWHETQKFIVQRNAVRFFSPHQ